VPDAVRMSIVCYFATVFEGLGGTGFFLDEKVEYEDLLLLLLACFFFKSASSFAFLACSAFFASFNFMKYFLT
jgi:hypothetical protein